MSAAGSSKRLVRAGGQRGSAKRVSLGVVDEQFIAIRASQATASGPGGSALAPSAAAASHEQREQPQIPRSASGVGFKEVTLSQQRNKALAKLGAAWDNNDHSQFHEKVATTSSWLPWRRGGGGRTNPFRLLPLKFHDPEMEEEYLHTAYLVHEPFLVWFLLLLALTHACVAGIALRSDLGRMGADGIARDEVAAAAALRLAAAVWTLLCAVAVVCNQLSRAAVTVCVGVAFGLLWASPLVALRLRGDAVAGEYPELLLLYFGAYGVLCPAFHIRIIAMLCGALVVGQAIVFATAPLVSSAPTRHVLINIELRELLKAVVVNALGVWLARRSERSHREIFVNAKLCREELMLRQAVCNDVQRLLMNTLPEPIVREIAAGVSHVAHRYENVTVLQADMVGFTPLSAARGPEEVLGILSELFAQFDQVRRLTIDWSPYEAPNESTG